MTWRDSHDPHHRSNVLRHRDRRVELAEKEWVDAIVDHAMSTCMCDRCGKPVENFERHALMEDKPELCGLVLGGRICIRRVDEDATGSRAAELDAALSAYRTAWVDLANVIPPLNVSKLHEGALAAALAAARVARWRGWLMAT
jgi:hypothetical protein